MKYNEVINECKSYIANGLERMLYKLFTRRILLDIAAFVEDAIKIYFGECIKVYCSVVDNCAINIFVEDKFLFDWMDDRYGKA